MNIRKIILAALATLSAFGGFAQDKIYKTDGTVIDAIIKSVGAQSIIYLRYDNPKGPEYTLSYDDVDKIKYEKGTEESFQDRTYRRSYERHKVGTYAPNVLAFAPIQFTENGIAGFSISYERMLDKQQIISFYMPAILEFNPNSQQTGNSDPMFYLMPGIKIYPTSANGLVKYAIGPSFVIADGSKTVVTQDPYSYVPTDTRESHFLAGVIVNQSVNINPSRHMYIGIEFGMGYTYTDLVGGTDQGAKFLTQFAFKLGYRY